MKIFSKYFRCPSCGYNLQVYEYEIVCTSCENRYPIIDGIPCLFPTTHSSESIPSFKYQQFYENPDSVGAMRLSYRRNAASRRMFISQSILRKHKPESMLDVSVGQGGIIELAVRNKVDDIVGVDISLSFLKMIQNRFGDRVLVVQVDARYLPIKEDSFDIIFCLNLIEHLDTYLDCIESVINTTKNIAVFSTDCYSLSEEINYMKFGEHEAGHLHHFNHFSIKEIFLKKTEIKKVIFHTFLPYVIFPNLINLFIKQKPYGLEKGRVFPAGPAFEFPQKREQPAKSLIAKIFGRYTRNRILQVFRLNFKKMCHMLLNFLEDESRWVNYIQNKNVILAPIYVLNKV